MTDNLLIEIADQAAIVRALQKKYFAARTQSALMDSKAAERKLDDLLSQYAAITAKKNVDTQRIGLDLEGS